MSNRGSFALIDRAAQATVAFELGENNDRVGLSRLGIHPQRTRSIAGLSVITNAARDAVVNPEAAKTVVRLKQYRTDREQVKSQLAAAGVPPLAVLPLSAWERICERAKVFRFIPQDDRVRFDASAVVAKAEELTKQESEREKLPDSVGGLGLIAMMIGAIAGAVGSANVLSAFGLGSAVTFLGIIVGFILGAFVGFLGFCLCFDNLPSRKKKMMEREARNIRSVVASLQKDGALLERLWPNYSEPAEGKTVRIALPPAPAKVQERLLAAEKAGLTMHLAAVGDAIVLREDVGDIIVGLRAKEWDVRGRELMLKYDPIIYVVHGSAVAVLDQFGEFPIEKEVINEVVNSEHFI